jgi:hypothetical protein
VNPTGRSPVGPALDLDAIKAREQAATIYPYPFDPIHWLRGLAANARTVPNESLAVACEKTIAEVERLRAEIGRGAAPPPQAWQPIETAPKDGTLIIGAYIVDGKVWRVHDMKHNGLAFYTVNGGSLPRMTHWTPMLEVAAPLPASAQEPQP